MKTKKNTHFQCCTDVFTAPDKVKGAHSTVLQKTKIPAKMLGVLILLKEDRYVKKPRELFMAHALILGTGNEWIAQTSAPGCAKCRIFHICMIPAGR